MSFSSRRNYRDVHNPLISEKDKVIHENISRLIEQF